MKIYTKTGDKGETSLFGGKRVPKYHARIEAYGTTDELNSFIGLIRDQEINGYHKEKLKEIQDRLFTMGSSLAADPEKSKLKHPDINEDDITMLEKEMDSMNEELPELKNFILPGGHPTVSYVHIARCICRRAERRVTELAENEPVPDLLVKYLNRLSDYLFVLARSIGKSVNAEENIWQKKA